jgi:hypothetical protein
MASRLIGLPTLRAVTKVNKRAQRRSDTPLGRSQRPGIDPNRPLPPSQPPCDVASRAFTGGNPSDEVSADGAAALGPPPPGAGILFERATLKTPDDETAMQLSAQEDTVELRGGGRRGMATYRITNDQIDAKTQHGTATITRAGDVFTFARSRATTRAPCGSPENPTGISKSTVATSASSTSSSATMDTSSSTQTAAICAAYVRAVGAFACGMRSAPWFERPRRLFPSPGSRAG